MDTLKIREKLHKLIDDADEDKLDALYKAMKSIDLPTVSWWEDANLINEFDSRIHSWVEEKGTAYTLEDLDREIAKRKAELNKKPNT